MKRLVVRDGTERPGGGLEFDLAEVLAALGPRGTASGWRANSSLTYTSRHERAIPILDKLGAGGTVGGDELIDALPELLQVLDGEFRASEDDQRAWVVIRAVDSSWWEFISDDPRVEAAVRSRFRSVEEASDGPAA